MPPVIVSGAKDVIDQLAPFDKGLMCAGESGQSRVVCLKNACLQVSPPNKRNAMPLIDGPSSLGEMAKRRKERTPKGLEVPVPTKGEFDAAMKKVAPPVGRRRPDEKDRPPQQSE